MSKHPKHWRSWTRNPSGARPPRAPAKVTSRPPALLERLEGRTLFSTFTVTNSLDDGSAGSLRWAVSQANANRGVLDIIEFKTAGQVTLTRGELVISDPLAIFGFGSVSGNNASRVFSINKGVSVGIEDLVIREGRCTFGDGGAIFNAGSLRLTDCAIADSSADGDGGGIYNAGTVVLKASVVARNTAGLDGGGIYNAGATSYNLAGGKVTVAGSFINIPGGIVPTFSRVLDNHAINGGGIYNAEGGEVGLFQLTGVASNSAKDYGGGVFNRGTATVDSSNVAYNGAGWAGGGVYNAGTATLTDSAFSTNGAAKGGGGIANHGTATLTNCTVSTNSAGLGGGGIYNGATVSLNNCTVTNNRSTDAGDAGGISNTGTATLNNTIVANSTSGGDVANSGTLTGGHNLIEDGSGKSGLAATVTGDPRLGPWANNGGGTGTHALLAGSPAIDAGDNGLIPADVTTDQTGSARIWGGIVDIGAYEFERIPTTVAVTTSHAVSSVYGQTVGFSVTVTAAGFTPAGSVSFVIDGGTPVAGVPGTTTTTTATWRFTTSTLGAGAHTFEAIFVDAHGVETRGTLSGGQTVNKANAAVVVTPYAVTYDGAPHVATVALITGVNGETGAAVGSVDLTSTSHTDAGTYGDFWSFTGGANYNDIAARPITNVINKAASAVVVTVDGGPFTYTGSAQTPATVSVTGPGGLSLTPAATYADNVDAGTAAARYNYAGDHNHEAGSGSATFSIGKAEAAVVVTPYTVTYDGNPHVAAVASITGVNGETGADVGTVVLSAAQTNAGTYSDSWSFTGGPNYNDIAGTAITHVISKAPSTTTVTVNGGPFTYTGLAQTPASASVTGAGGLALTSAATYADNVNAGIATAGYSFAGDANHEASSDSETFTIAKAAAAFTVTPYAVTYDGNPHTATVSTVTGVNSETGAAVGTVTLSPAHTDAGTYGDAWGFTGTANYNDVAPTAITNVINKAVSTVVVTINGGPFTYNGLAQTPATVSVTGAGGLDLTRAASYADNVNAGTALASYSYAGDANHEVGIGSTSFAIGKADATVVVAPYTVTYDGSPHAATVASITGVNGETGATVGGVNVSNTSHTNAGTYNDSWSLAGTANYNDVAATTITNTINKAALTITAGEDTKVYGTLKTFGGAAFTQAGLVTGDAITGVTTTSPGAAAAAAVGTYPIVPGAATGTGLGNYDITYVSGTLTVVPPLTVPTGVQTAYEDVAQPISGISIAGELSGSLTLTLGVGHGTLTLGTTTGLAVAGNGSGSVTLTGTTADLNAALTGLVYRGSLNYAGSDTLSLALGNGSFSWNAGVAIAVKSASQQTVDLAVQINTLVKAGVLTSGQGEALNLNLRDNNGDAGKVGAYLDQVSAFLSSGILTQAQAAALQGPGNVLLLGVSRR